VLESGTQERLRELLGPAAAVRNPVDVAGAADSDLGVFGEALRIIVADLDVAGVLLVGLFGGYHLRFSRTFEAVEVEAAERMLRDSAAAEKLVVVHSVYAQEDSPALSLLREGGVPVTPSLDIACRCVEVAVRRRDLSSRSPVWRSGDLPSPTHHEVREGSSPQLDSLTEWQVREKLALHGVEFPEGLFVREVGDLHGRSWESPAALKVISPGIPLKTEADGVLLNV